MNLLKNILELNRMKNWKEDRLKIIKEILPALGDNFYLKGGTALLFYYGLDRFSEDIDLDSTSTNMDITGKLKRLNHKDWNLSIKKNTETVFRVMVNYGATNQNGDYPLKIEISSRNKNLLREKFFKCENFDGVNVYSLDEILKMKIRAFDQRDKIRDFYDLAFYLKKNPEKFTEDMLYSFKEKMDYKDLDTLAILLNEEFKNNELKKIDGEKIVLETYDKLEELLIQRIKEKNKVNQTFDEILENPDVVDKYVDEKIINTKSVKTTEKINEDKKQLLLSVANNGMLLKELSDKFKDDKEVVMEAVKNNAFALEFASDRLKNDKEVVTKAVEKNPLTLVYSNLKMDKEFLKKLSKEHSQALMYADKEVKKEIEDEEKNIDRDLDGLTDKEEILLGTNVFSRDTDGDGKTDKEEKIKGDDPKIAQKDDKERSLF